MIRTATMDDLERMVDVAEECAVNLGIMMSLKRARSHIELMIMYGFAAVVEVDGLIVGGMLGDTFTPWYSNIAVGAESNICLLPHYRNRFISIKLVKMFEEWCKNMGVTMICPSVSTGSKGAVNLYESMGYRSIGNNYCKRILI